MGACVAPWTLEGFDLGSDVLEIGPGYGAGTDLLCGNIRELTCVEVDPALAERLRRRIGNRNVTVVCEDATRMSFPDTTFDGVASFTMLHHIPLAVMQDRLPAEAIRVLRPGGILAGTDSIDSRVFRLFSIR